MGLNIPQRSVQPTHHIPWCHSPKLKHRTTEMYIGVVCTRHASALPTIHPGSDGTCTSNQGLKSAHGNYSRFKNINDDGTAQWSSHQLCLIQTTEYEGMNQALCLLCFFGIPAYNNFWVCVASFRIMNCNWSTWHLEDKHYQRALGFWILQKELEIYNVIAEV